MENKNWGVIGSAGNSVSLIRGLLAKDSLKLSQLTVSNEDFIGRRIPLLEELGVKIICNNQRVIDECDIVVLDLPPYALRYTIEELRPCSVRQRVNTTLFVSMVPGISTKKIEELLDGRLLENPRVIRVLANKSCSDLLGCCAYAIGQNRKNGEVKFIRGILSGVGHCEEVEESKFDALSAVAISGTSIIYAVIEAIIDGGIEMNLPANMATKYAVKMAVGTSKSLLPMENDCAPVHPVNLRVTECSQSPSTAEALYALEKKAFRGSLISAIEAAVVQTRKDAKKEMDKPAPMILKDSLNLVEDYIDKN